MKQNKLVGLEIYGISQAQKNSLLDSEPQSDICDPAITTCFLKGSLSLFFPSKNMGEGDFDPEVGLRK